MEEQIEKKPLYLSASKIKTATTCSWQYYASYVLGIPQSGNSGASRGTIVHNLFELISKPKHQHFIKKIWTAGSPEKIPQIKRFLERQFKNEKIIQSEDVKPIKVKWGKLNNWETVCQMIMTTMKLEFIDKSLEHIIDSEYEFNIVNESPRYAIRGFIDRVEKNEAGELRILDYKSSAKKFKGEEQDSNIQAMIYSLVARKTWKNFKKYKASFLFMRFIDDPYQDSEFSEPELQGLESYLEYLTNYLEDFNMEKAKSNLANSDLTKSWLCGRGKWVCPYRDRVTFYRIYKKDQPETGKGVASYLKIDEAQKHLEDLNKKEDLFEIKIMNYAGCPAFHSTAT
jgi:ATP-dependent helicase/DNAse subunit B